MLAVLAPGQGSQRAGCLRPWLDDPAATEALGRTGLSPDLVATGADPDADVVDTAVAQPLIVGLGLAAADLLGSLAPGTVCVGHSVGELTAAAAGGALTPPAAVRLAAVRGQAMAAAAAAAPTGMAAVLGGDAAVVSEAIRRAGASVANHNGPGQLVAAGTEEALQQLAADPPAGARVRRLPVAGAFHTRYMASAAGPLARAVAEVRFASPLHGFVSGLDGALVSDPEEISRRLVTAVTEAVRWDRCLLTLDSLGVTGCIELPPGGVLTALVRRHLPHVEVVAVQSPDDLPAAHELLRRHQATGGEGADDLRVLVAPAAGTWERIQPGLPVARDGEPLPLGRVNGRRDQVDVALPAGDRVTEWLAVDGDPVREGQPLARTSVSGRTA